MWVLLILNVLIYCYAVQALEPATDVHWNETLLILRNTSWFSLGGGLAQILYKNDWIR